MTSLRPFAGCTPVVVAALWLLAADSASGGQGGGVAPQATPAARSAALIARGLEYGYNLDYDESMAAFTEAIAVDAQNATAHRLTAAAIWMHLLFEQGAVSVEDYLGQARPNLTRQAPDPTLADAFRQHLDRATAIAVQRVRARPLDVDAHFQLGAAAGFRASYIATIDGRVFDGFGAARRAFNEHRRVLTLDPGRKDAGLIVGLYRYGVSSLSLPMRIMARLVGFPGGREEGLRLVEEAARHPSEVQTNARFMLVLIYNRERRHLEALEIIRQLQQQYPRNRLLWLEAASTTLRAARPAEALQTVDRGLAQFANDARPRAFGEPARWRYLRGVILAAMHEDAAAVRELQAALSGEALPWIRGRAQLELGKFADLAGDRPRAIGHYATAIANCDAGHDEVCSDDAKRFARRAYVAAGR